MSSPYESYPKQFQLPKKRKFIPNASSWDDAAFQSSVKQFEEFQIQIGHLPIKMIPKDYQGVQEGTSYCQDSIPADGLQTKQGDGDGGPTQPPGVHSDTTWLLNVKDSVTASQSIPNLAEVANDNGPTQPSVIVPVSANTARLFNQHLQRANDQAIGTLLENAQETDSDLSYDDADHNHRFRDDGFP